MRTGYAAGVAKRGWLTRLGYSLPVPCQAGLVTAGGYDTYIHRIVFSLEVISTAAVCRLWRRRTGFCREPRADCICGSESGNLRNASRAPPRGRTREALAEFPAAWISSGCFAGCGIVPTAICSYERVSIFRPPTTAPVGANPMARF